MNDPRIQTYGGGTYNPLAPLDTDINIEVIAHALSNQCRFSGHSAFHYSVAQHSVLVSRLCRGENALWGLLHDSSEAFLVDLPRPIKRAPEFWFYETCEERSMDAVCRVFGMCKDMPEDVHEADMTALAIEARCLMQPVSPIWGNFLGEWDTRPDIVVRRMSPTEAKALFLERYRALTARRVEDEHVIMPDTEASSDD